MTRPNHLFFTIHLKLLIRSKSPHPRVQTTRARITVIPGMLLVGILFMAPSACTSLYFFPNQHQYDSPDRYRLTYQDVLLPMEAQVSLHGWWLYTKNTAPLSHKAATIIFVHGNALNISGHLHQIAWLPQHGFNVFTYDFRGFGLSDGQSDLANSIADLRRVIKFIRGTRPGPLFVMAQSLGGAVAVGALSGVDQACVQGLILDSVFSDYREIVAHQLRRIGLGKLAFPVTRLFPNRDHPWQLVGGLSMPLLLLHGTGDHVVPFTHGRRLAALAPGAQLLAIEGGGHTEAMRRGDVRKRLVAFLQSLSQTRHAAISCDGDT